MILLLGGTGYIGSQFISELDSRGIEYMNISRSESDYYNYTLLYQMLRELKPRFLINCAGYTGKPNVDACEIFQEDTFKGNVTLPSVIAKACAMARVPWGHVSSGCIYNGYDKKFTEEDESNFSFDVPPCSYYSGTKALGEQKIKEIGEDYYIWRLRIPFDEYDSGRNYLSKLMKYDKLLNSKNSISHRADFVSYCLDLYLYKCEYGIYNVVNSRPVSTKVITNKINKILGINKDFKFFENEKEMYKSAAATPRSNCTLDNAKLRKQLGKHDIKVRTSLQAVEEALENWKGIEKNEDSRIDESFWK
jgi:UDP-glucose 4,6-dehydratase